MHDDVQVGTALFRVLVIYYEAFFNRPFWESKSCIIEKVKVFMFQVGTAPFRVLALHYGADIVYRWNIFDAPFFATIYILINVGL